MVSLFGFNRGQPAVPDASPQDLVIQAFMRRLDFLEYDRLVTHESMLEAHEKRMKDLDAKIMILGASIATSQRDGHMEQLPAPSLTAGMAAGGSTVRRTYCRSPCSGPGKCSRC